MSGGVNNVNDHATFEPKLLSGGTAIVDCSVLGENRNALFAFKIARIHHALAGLLNRIAFVESTRLPQHRINQGGLTMVNVCNNRDIS